MSPVQGKSHTLVQIKEPYGNLDMVYTLIADSWFSQELEMR